MECWDFMRRLKASRSNIERLLALSCPKFIQHPSALQPKTIFARAWHFRGIPEK